MTLNAKNVRPLYLHYFGTNEAVLYNLTKQQYETICESNIDPSDILRQFELPTTFDQGYVPDVIVTLCNLLDVEVDSE